MRITRSEKQFIALHRERIKLDSTNWAQEPYVTAKQLVEMSGWKAQQLLSDPRFVRDEFADILRNTGMPNDHTDANGSRGGDGRTAVAVGSNPIATGGYSGD